MHAFVNPEILQKGLIIYNAKCKAPVHTSTHHIYNPNLTLSLPCAGTQKTTNKCSKFETIKAQNLCLSLPLSVEILMCNVSLIHSCLVYVYK